MMHTPQERRTYKAGFSLVELAVLLVIISILIVGGIGMGTNQINNAKQAETEKKLATIEEALMTFRKLNNRIPCPGDSALEEDDANLGTSAGSPGQCTGASFSATGVAAGAVPVKALGLPNSFLTDGWGQRFHYAAYLPFTGIDGFATRAVNETCGGLTVNDASGTARTTGAAYVLLSYGKNGHGGFTKNGSRSLTASSMNADEWENCDCNQAAFGTGYDSVYVDHAFTANPNDVQDKFDDIVRYKVRWQMQSTNDESPYTGIELMAVGNFTNYVKFYERSNCGYSEFTDVDAFPTDLVRSAAFSHDNQYAAVGSGSVGSYVRIYKKGTGASYKSFTSIIPTQPATSTIYAMAFSSDDHFLAVGHDNAPYLTVYEHPSGTDTFTLLSGAQGPQTDPANMVYAVAFSRNGNYLAAGFQGGIDLHIYKRNETTFDLLPSPGVSPGGAVTGIGFSPNDNYLMVGLFTAPYLVIYKRTGDTFTQLPDPSDMPNGTVRSFSYSYDGRYVAVGTDSGLHVYKRSGDTFTEIADPSTTNGNTIYGVSFSADSGFLALASGNTPYLTVYERSGDTFTLLPNPPQPDNYLESARFRN